MSIAMQVETFNTPGSQDSPSAEVHAANGANGRLRVQNLADTDKHLALAIHLSPFASFFIPIALFAPLVIWLVRKDKSEFVNDHGREMVNVLITGMLVIALGVLGCLVTIGIGAILIVPAIIVWYVAMLINTIRACVAAGNCEYFRYPMTIRLLS